ncbi:hypothetical protein K1719_035595 [Acacia pycnantha]|nr:hypothetical protein K1719_035595 [Acacia pycnantha]
MAIVVNSLNFHLVHHIFATANSDGACNSWDKDNKERLKVNCPGLRPSFHSWYTTPSLQTCPSLMHVFCLTFDLT